MSLAAAAGLYLRTAEGWLYLAAVQDAYSRAIIGWSMATHVRATLVVDALNMALARRRPGPGLIHHSDQGGQYVSLAFGVQCARPGSLSTSRPKSSHIHQDQTTNDLTTRVVRTGAGP
jgi:transposase InsO family protein